MLPLTAVAGILNCWDELVEILIIRWRQYNLLQFEDQQAMSAGRHMMYLLHDMLKFTPRVQSGGHVAGGLGHAHATSNSKDY